MTDYFYETGTHTNLDDFFSKLSAFCVSGSIDAAYRFTAGASNGTAGTAVNTAGAASGTTYAYKRFSMTRGSYYWLARYHSAGGVYCMPSPNDASMVWNNTTGKPYYDYNISPIISGGSYHFMQYKNSINAVCILASGVHIHLNFGTLAKVGSWTGGEFFTGTYQDTGSGFVNGLPYAPQHCFGFQQSNGTRQTTAQKIPVIRCVYNTKDFAHINTYTDGSVYTGYNAVLSVGGIVISNSVLNAGATANVMPNYSPNHYAPYRSSGIPIELQLIRNAHDNLCYDLGTVEGMRYTNIAALESGDIINTDWIVFPLSIKGTVGSTGNYAATADYGVAYYKGP